MNKLSLGMPDTLTITISPQDISGRRYMSIQNCPLAAAIRRQTPYRDIWVGGVEVDINDVEYRFDGDKWGLNQFLEGEPVTLLLTKHKS